MNANDRLQAARGQGLTIGPHPMSLLRTTLALRGVLRAIDLVQARDRRPARARGGDGHREAAAGRDHAAAGWRTRSVKAERLEALDTLTASIDAHDFY